jgi:RNA 3'-terminal phosphate cyclase
MQPFLIPREPWDTPALTEGYWRGPFIVNRHRRGWAVSSISGLALAVHADRQIAERMADALRTLDIDWYAQYRPDSFTAAQRHSITSALAVFAR